jgi:fumarate hydratase class II
MPLAVLHALALIKKAAARVNDRNGDLPADIARLIEQAADEVLDGQHDDQFPLVVWQTGSGTQSNMNVNEVIAGRANELAGKGRGGKVPVHPNDHVNRSQSSNDCFPTAMHIAAAQAAAQLLPAIAELSSGLAELSARHQKLVKTGRTHMMDATPITFGQEVSAFVAQLDYAQRAIRATCRRCASWPRAARRSAPGSTPRMALPRPSPPSWPPSPACPSPRRTSSPPSPATSR